MGFLLRLCPTVASTRGLCTVSKNSKRPQAAKDAKASGSNMCPHLPCNSPGRCPQTSPTLGFRWFSWKFGRINMPNDQNGHCFHPFPMWKMISKVYRYISQWNGSNGRVQPDRTTGKSALLPSAQLPRSVWWSPSPPLLVWELWAKHHQVKIFVFLRHCPTSYGNFLCCFCFLYLFVSSWKPKGHFVGSTAMPRPTATRWRPKPKPQNEAHAWRKWAI